MVVTRRTLQPRKTQLGIAALQIRLKLPVYKPREGAVGERERLEQPREAFGHDRAQGGICGSPKLDGAGHRGGRVARCVPPKS